MREQNGYLVFAAIAFIVFVVTVVACGDDDDDDDDDDDATDDDASDDDAADDDAACGLEDACAAIVACDYYDDVEFCAEAVVSDCLTEEGRQAIEDCLCDCTASAVDCDATSACVDTCVPVCYEV
ncbi:MAG: hypothetical protein IT350_09670 [Deltaproteobacteria bacterium]|nr:hypothetical protein [Deltaproteobacteria bacterium]